MAMHDLPTEWSDADQLSGFDLHNKDDLVGVPFRIFQIQFRTNKNGVRLAVLTVERIDGEKVQFQDSSTTGVCAQAMQYVTDQGRSDAIDSGEPVAINLVAPRGLRVSAYPTQVRGKTVDAKSHYLTASGMLEEPAAAPEPKKAARTPRKRA